MTSAHAAASDVHATFIALIVACHAPAEKDNTAA
jgi:hypothetical protein